MIIRDARPEDIKPMVDLGRLMWEEGVFTITEEYSEADCLAFALNAVEKHMLKEEFFVQVAHEKDNPQDIIAMVIGQTVPYFIFKKACFAVDHVVYIKKNLRGGTLAYRMTKNFEDWARKKGALEVSLGVSTGIHPEKTHKFYTKMGYKHVGGIYKKAIKES